MKRKRLLLLLILLTNFSFSQEDTTKTTIADLSLEELLELEVFSASKKHQLESEAPAMITVIQQSAFRDYGALTLIDVLKFIPGIEASIGSDGHYRVSLRGSRKDGTILVLINGQQINDFYNGEVIFDLPVDFIDKIEVIRGPGSAIYGSNAAAGVINIFTSKQTSASVSGGINALLNANVNYHKQKKDITCNLSLGYFQSNGSRQLIDTDKVQDRTWSLAHLDKNYKTNRWNKDGYINAGLSYKDLHFKLFNIYRQQGLWVGPLFIAAPDSRHITNQFAVNVYYDYKIGDNVIVTPKLYYNQNDIDHLSQETPDNYISSVSGDLFANGKLTRERYKGTTYGSALDIYIKANEHLDILTGSVFEDLALRSYDVTRNYKIVGDVYKGDFGNYDNIALTQNKKRRFVFAYFVQANYKIRKLTVTAGMRYDDYNDFGQSVNPRLGITYSATPYLNFKGLYGKAFRAPTFRELYDNSTIGNDYGVKGNEELIPENIHTVELGTEVKIRKMILRYNIYYIRNTDLIRVYDPHGGGSIGIYENIGNIDTYGNAASVSIPLFGSINIFANYSQFYSTFEWNKTKVRAADVAFLNKQPDYYKELRNIPTLRINAGISYTINKIFVALGFNYGNASENNKRFYLETDHYASIPSYFQGAFSLGYSFTEKLNLSIMGNSIGTKKYSDPDESTNINAFGTQGLIQPGPSVFIKVIYKL